MIRLLAFDLGLNVGFALLAAGQRPQAGSFRINRRATDLGGIKVDFDERAEELFARFKPNAVARASRFVNRYSNPTAIGPYFGLSMVLDGMATVRGMKHYEVAESDARKAFCGHVPRGSKAQKRAVMTGCHQRGWWCADDHGCDAQCIGAHVLSFLVADLAHETTPLFTKRRRKAA